MHHECDASWVRCIMSAMHHECDASLTCVRCPIRATWDMSARPYSYVRHDSCDLTHSYVGPVSIRTYIYIYMYTYTYVYVYTRIHVYMYIYVYVYKYMHVYVIHICTYTHIHIYVDAYIYDSSVCLCVWMCVCDTTYLRVHQTHSHVWCVCNIKYSYTTYLACT